MKVSLRSGPWISHGRHGLSRNAVSSTRNKVSVASAARKSVPLIPREGAAGHRLSRFLLKKPVFAMTRLLHSWRESFWISKYAAPVVTALTAGLAGACSVSAGGSVRGEGVVAALAFGALAMFRSKRGGKEDAEVRLRDKKDSDIFQSRLESSTIQLLQELVKFRDSFPKDSRPSLLELAKEAVAKGSIPKLRADEIGWAVHSREFFEQSEILRAIPQEKLHTPEAVVQILAEVRLHVAREQGRESYALATLVEALIFGEKIPFGLKRRLMSAAASYDLFHNNLTLQKAWRSEWARDPYALVRGLNLIRDRIKDKQGRPYHLTTLVDALSWHPKFARKHLRQISMIAGAYDYVSTLNLQKMQLTLRHLKTLRQDQLLLRLLRLRELFVAAGDGGTNGIGYVLMGLRAHGLHRMKDGIVNDSLVRNAYNLDVVCQNWERWAPYILHLSKVPRGRERLNYAKKYFTKETGVEYGDSYLGALLRWGEFLWEHRQTLNLRVPEAADVSDVPLGVSAQLPDFLQPHWARLKGLEVKEFFDSLLELRGIFLREAGNKENFSDRLNLGAMIHAIRILGGKISRTVEVYVGMIDQILRRWPDWAGHFKKLSQMPLGRSEREGWKKRYDTARDLLVNSSGERFKESYLRFIVRWGLQVLEHQDRFGLSSGELSKTPLSEEKVSAEIQPSSSHLNP